MTRTHHQRTGSLAWLAAAFGMAGLAPAAMAASAWDGMAASPVWGNFQWGRAYLQRRGEAMKELDASSHYWRIEGGMRINKEWMVGVGTQHVPLASYNKLSQLYGTVVFNPDRGRWLYQAGFGKARYSATYDGGGFQVNQRHSGLAANLALGLDWTPKLEDVHFGARLNYEYSGLGDADSGPGSFNHSRISIGFSASFY